MSVRACLLLVVVIPACGSFGDDPALTVPTESGDAGYQQASDAPITMTDVVVPAHQPLADGSVANPVDLAGTAAEAAPCTWRGLAASASYPFPGNFYFLRAADLDGDGRLDLVGTSPYHGSYSVLLGAANGFAPVREYALNDWVSGIVVADLDEDGHVDIALAASATQLGPGTGIGIALNRGDGTFAEPVLFATDRGWDGLGAGDLDGDGHVDLAATGYRSATRTSSLAIFRNLGNGTFVEQASSATSSRAVHLEMADLDRDGRLDIVTYDGSAKSGGIWLNRGNGGFGMPAMLALGAGVFSFALADFDRDGYPDLAAASQDLNQVSVLRNGRDGTFAGASTYAAGQGSNQIVAGDMDGDGAMDIVVVNPASQTIGLLRNRGDGTFEPQATYPTSYGPMAVVIGDFDRDGYRDVAVACSSGSLDVLRGECR